jgi:hypothetical protein
MVAIAHLVLRCFAVNIGGDLHKSVYAYALCKHVLSRVAPLFREHSYQRCPEVED